jgi:glycosyltransferase involved in cell wall biosynthesis/Flp pilus assembly protein TadD
MPKLSVCLIVKNEEAHLARCLQSVRGLWDELVVVDTGSTDGTADIARQFGARLLQFTWRDDFSLARNFFIEQATGDWILSIDADETIAARDHALIRAQIASDALDAVTVVQRHYLAGTVIGWQPGDGGYDEGKPYGGFLDTECRRLFRKRPWLRFENRVHEILVTTDPARPIAHVHGGWVIHHFGKVGDREVLRAKGEHYLRILQRKVEEHPADPQAHHELGVQHHELRQYDAALASFERVLALSPGYSDTYLQIAMARIGLNQTDEAFAALRVAGRELPALAAEIALAEGNLHRDSGDPAAAEDMYRRGLARKPAWAALSVNLAILLRDRGRLADALDTVARGLEHNPTHGDLSRLQAQLARAHARSCMQQRRPDEAARCLDLVGDTRDAEVLALRGAIALTRGNIADAVTDLQASLSVTPTHEAALNLSAALEGSGDRAGALRAAATAVGLLPGDGATVTRFRRVAGDTLATGNARGAGERLAIYFYMPRGAAFDGQTPRTKGLGGTESALVYLAEALATRGHRAVIFNHCDTPCTVGDVEYASWQTLPVRCVADRPDVVVAVRDWRLIGQLRLAPLQLFWTLDAFDQAFLANLGDRQARAAIDFVVVGSDWQAATFREHHDVPAWQMVVTRQGTAASAAHSDATRRPASSRTRKLVYLSTPFRGLDVLLDLFPRIRAACPDAELDVFSSMRVYGWSAADDEREFAALYAKARQPGVTLVGTRPQLELAERLQQARVLAYPNHYAETFCIAAIEAQAAGCAVVTTALGALPQTVGEGGICIPGDPRSRAYQDAFVGHCVRLLTDDTQWENMSRAAFDRAWRDYTWLGVAREWETLCRRALAAEPATVQRVAVHLAAGRGALAQKIVEREAAPGDVPNDAWEALRTFTAWRAGSADQPPPSALLQVALHFPSLRRSL